MAKKLGIALLLVLLITLLPTAATAITGTGNYNLNPIVNGSFETGDYTGWTLWEGDGPFGHDAEFGTWGIAQNGETINYMDITYDYFDQTDVIQLSDLLPRTYETTEGNYLAYQLQNAEEVHRMYQDVSIGRNQALKWDMFYDNWAGIFDDQEQYLAIHIRNPQTDEILETAFKTDNDLPQTIPMTSFDYDLSAYGDQVIRIDVELTVFWGYLDAGFENFKIEYGGLPSVIDNGSFETGDYTGWTLWESGIGGFSPQYAQTEGTWGIALNSETIITGQQTMDYFDGVMVTQNSINLPRTYETTNGLYMAYQLQNLPEEHRMYQDVTIPAKAKKLSWDMFYQNYPNGIFDENLQYLAVHIRNPQNDRILKTLFETKQNTAQNIAMTSFSENISQFAGRTVRIDVEMKTRLGCMDAGFDNFDIDDRQLQRPKLIFDIPQEWRQENRRGNWG